MSANSILSDIECQWDLMTHTERMDYLKATEVIALPLGKPATLTPQQLDRILQILERIPPNEFEAGSRNQVAKDQSSMLRTFAPHITKSEQVQKMFTIISHHPTEAQQRFTLRKVIEATKIFKADPPGQCYAVNARLAKRLG